MKYIFIPFLLIPLISCSTNMKHKSISSIEEANISETNEIILIPSNLIEESDTMALKHKVAPTEINSSLSEIEDEPLYLDHEEETAPASFDDSYASLKSEEAELSSSWTQIEHLKNTIKQMESDYSAIVLAEKRSNLKVFDVLDNFKKNLPKGSMIYNIPKAMTKGDTQTVTLEITPKRAIEKLKLELSKREGIPLSNFEEEKIQVSNIMSANLSASDGLGVTSLNKTNTIAISSTAPNIWRWNVEAKKEGTQKLFLQVGIVLKIKGEDRVSHVLDEPREIIVNISTGRGIIGFVNENWQFLVQILLIPLILFTWEKIKKFIKMNKTDDVLKPQVIIK